jgi:hypothetical protein
MSEQNENQQKSLTREKEDVQNAWSTAATAVESRWRARVAFSRRLNMTLRFFRLMLGSGLLLIGTTALAQEAAPAPNRGAIEIGLRLGVGFPLGHEGATAGATNDKLSDDLKAIIPIAIDAGYRINPTVYVGLLFQYGFGSSIRTTVPMLGAAVPASAARPATSASASTFTSISPPANRSTPGWAWGPGMNGCSWT